MVFRNARRSFCRAASVVSIKSVNLHALRKAEARVSTAKPMNPREVSFVSAN